MDIFEQMQMTLAELDSQPDPCPVQWLAGEQAGWRCGHLQQLQSALSQLEHGDLQGFRLQVARVHHQTQPSLALLACPELLTAVAEHPETILEIQMAAELVEELQQTLDTLGQAQSLQQAQQSLAWFTEILAEIDSLQQNLLDQLQNCE